MVFDSLLRRKKVPNQLTAADSSAFLRTRAALQDQLSPEMGKWNLSKLLTELRTAINSCGQKNRCLRYFSRHQLNLKGERHKRVTGWFLQPSSMTEKEVSLVFRTLLRLRTDGGGVVKKERDVKRRLINHAITLFNSFDRVISEAGVSPSDCTDGDRMEIQDAMKRFCEAFGIRAKFSDPSEKLSRPVTAEEITRIGL